jgi:hypothetical protein
VALHAVGRRPVGADIRRPRRGADHDRIDVRVVQDA